MSTPATTTRHDVRSRAAGRHGRWWAAAAAGVAVSLAVPSPALARADALDRSFGRDGIVTTDFAGLYDRALAVAALPHGAVAVAGNTGIPNGGGITDFGVTRYHANGTLDRRFGGDGRVTTDFFGSELANALVAQPDGKLVVAGAAFHGGSDPEFALARYRRDGSLDRDFGVGGRVTTDLGGHDVITALVRQPDGKLLAAGYSATSTSTPEQIALARYLPDGRLDPGFGDGGRVITVLGGFSLANEVALRPDGRFVVAGQTATASGGLDFAVVAYHPDGSLDESFGAGGVVTTDFSTGGDEAHSLIVQSDRLIVAGTTVTLDSGTVALAAYRFDGSLDPNFGDSGTTATTIQAHGPSLIAHRDGVIVGLIASSRTSVDFTLLRYTAAGAIDTGFGVDGMLQTDIDGATIDELAALAWQPDGRLLAAGMADYPQRVEGDFAVARYRIG